MGNNGSSSQQHCASSGTGSGSGSGRCLPGELARGWTHSFPRELTRHHHSQPGGQKVLPEPSNQRLRATNNGSIIQNGGTISGRRPPALTLPHDLNKQGVFRSRSTSASNMLEGRGRRMERHCCFYQVESKRPEGEMQELKRFGSEPDLRCSPADRCSSRCQTQLDHRRASGHYPDRDSKERESRYRAKKKYRAPAPPGNGVVEGSSPDSYNWELGQEPDVHPPPRKSRLFKTRAETKKTRVNWHSSSSSSSAQPRRREKEVVPEGKRRGDRGNFCRESCKETGRASRSGSRERERLERCCREDQRRKILDGKNTLQRSMSSPEFQAELIQVARKVRDKLHCNGRISSPEPSKFASLERRLCEAGRGKDRLLGQQDRHPEDASNGSEKRLSTGHRELAVEDRKLLEEKLRADRARKSDGKTKDRQADCPRDADRKRSEERVEPLPESCTNYGEERPGRMPLRERLERPGEPRLPPEKRKSEHDYGKSGERDSGKAGKRGAEDASSPVPLLPQYPKDRSEPRGASSGKSASPEQAEGKARDKENSDPRWWKGDPKNNRKKSGEKRWPGAVASEKADAQQRSETETDGRADHWHPHSSAERTAPKTFYFGMNETSVNNEPRSCAEQPDIQIPSRLQEEECRSTMHTAEDADDGRNVVEDISLKLRPTLPKKQLEIPRFSPSAAWRLLSALEAPGPTMSTASEEMPVMFEERIERLSRPPPPAALLALGPRSLHDKSGDSGISGDAGAAIEDSVDVSTTNRMKTGTTMTRPTWTPQQDLGEESSSDAGVDSPPPIPTPLKFPSRPHVFSLSLPRDDGRPYLCAAEFKGKDSSAFNSLQKLKRSVSGALGFGPSDFERKRTRGTLDDNWLLSTSAPTSLQHNQVTELARFELEEDGHRVVPVDEDEDADDDEDEDEEEDEEDRSFPVIMKPPSFSYLASGGHVMYLPESSNPEYRAPNSAGRKQLGTSERGPIYRKNGAEEVPPRQQQQQQQQHAGAGAYEKPSGRVERDSRITGRGCRSRNDDVTVRSTNKLSALSKSCENITEMKQRSDSPTVGERQSAVRESQRTAEAKEHKGQPKTGSKSRRFTFQSTVRQIERRRLAEKLSREAEAKERQRKGELEAMRKVEEEFQRKRAREKANIRQQLRLYNMEENLNNLPTAWNSSQMSRADPDGAPSSTASSPISAPLGKPSGGRKGSVSSDEYHRKRASSSESRQQQQHQDHRNYRPKYYDWAPESSSHIEYKQTTVHPKIVCDIPKSSAAFVDANPHGKVNSSSTPRSDNYRKDFAHGAVQAARSSLASSDSELSQPNTRPHSRETASKPRPLRSRSASPERSEGGASSGDETPVEPVKRDRNPIHDFILNGVQPFVREKSYRPISFNPQPPPPIPS